MLTDALLRRHVALEGITRHAEPIVGPNGLVSSNARIRFHLENISFWVIHPTGRAA